MASASPNRGINEFHGHRFHLPVSFFRCAPRMHVFAASLGLNGEARRNRQASVGHFGQSAALSAQLVVAAALGLASTKEIDIFHSLLLCRYVNKVG